MQYYDSPFLYSDGSLLSRGKEISVTLIAVIDRKNRPRFL